MRIDAFDPKQDQESSKRELESSKEFGELCQLQRLMLESFFHCASIDTAVLSGESCTLHVLLGLDSSSREPRPARGKALGVSLIRSRVRPRKADMAPQPAKPGS
jgi:hypothetical protein